MEQTATELYRKLEADRDLFLNRARKCSALTLPTLIPWDDHQSSAEIETPYQAFGARAVNNLASKLLLSLLPPNGSFFRLRIDDYALEQLAGAPEAKSEIEAALAKVEGAVMTEIETQAIRINMFEALKHLLVAGNVLLWMKPQGGIRVFHLSQYVIDRDPDGSPTCIVTIENTSEELLTEEQHALCYNGDSENEGNGSREKSVQIYTAAVLEDGKWRVWQEIKNQMVPGSEGFYSSDRLPYIPLRMSAIANESYGRSMVEEYLGDLISLEGLSQAIVETAACAAKLLVLVNPAGVTRKEDVATAPNGAVRDGTAEDVSVVQAEKYADMRIAQEARAQIMEDLSKAFLMASSVQRNAERVTAEEIRYLAQELEDALGGVYSVLSLEMQLPLVTRLLADLQKKGRVPRLPPSVRPAIVTGLEALGRGHDLQKLDTFVAGALNTFGPEIVTKYIDIRDFLTRRAVAVGLNVEGLVKSADVIAQEDAQQQQSAMAATLGGPAISAMSKMLPQMMAGQEAS